MLRIHPRLRHVRYTLSTIPSRKETSPRLFTPRNRKKKKNTKFPFNLQRFIEEIVPRAKEIKEPCPDLRLWRLFISVESSRLLLVQISGNRFLLSVSPGKRDDNRLYLRLYNIPSSLHYFSLLNRSMSTNDPSARFAFRWWMDRARRFHPDDGIWILD